MHMDLGTVLGALGVIFSFASCVMKSMRPLRTIALLSNVFFVGYGYVESLWPSLLLNASLLPVNAMRLWEINRLKKAIARATADTPVSQWLLPNMRHRAFKAGEVLFRKGDVADKLIYIAEGELTLVEIGRHIGHGELIGEIGLFSPDNKRTQTIVCDSDGDLYYMDADMMYQLYYQNAKLGFYLIRLVAARLLQGTAAVEGRSA
jgi:CRP/FNR family transcriptional regulator, cyclic AMP receptor protein